MATATAGPATFTDSTSIPGTPSCRRTLWSAVADASALVAELALDDPCWETVGPCLTGFVDAARLSAGQPRSPIRAGEVVAPVLRLRDLARLAQITATSELIAGRRVESTLRSLRAAALR